MNVLFIVTDQLRYDCVGAAGIRPVKTPNMDRLASEGLFFENAYTPLPVCAPSRQAMLTGVQPDSIGALFNYNFINTRGADPAVPTWVSELKDRGYRCGFAGHWDASPNGNENAFGYETVFDGAAWSKEIGEKYGPIDYPNSWFGCSNPIAFDDTKTYRICESSAAFIRESAGRPWHIWVDITDPHLPCRPSAPYDTMYRPEDIEPWPGFGDTLEGKPYIQKKQIENWNLEGRTWEEFSHTAAYYYGMISQTDAAVGQLLRALVVAHEVRHVRAGFRDGQIDHHVGRRGVQRPRLDARLDGDGGAGLVAPRRFRRPPDRVRSPALDERVHITPDIGDVRPADGDPSAAGGVGDDVKRDDGVLAQREVDSRPL